MSRKVAVASIMCLLLGGISLPGGIILNNFITDLTYSSVDEGILGIKEEGLPMIEPMIKQYGSGEALRQIKDIGTLAIEDLIYQMGPAIALSTIEDMAPKAIKEMILQMGPAIALDLIREQAINTSGPLLNATIWMNQIYNVEDMLGVGGLLGIGAGDEELLYWDVEDKTYLLFVRVSFSGQAEDKGYPLIKGLSEWFGADLHFGTLNIDGPDPNASYGVNHLKYGADIAGWWGDHLPGIFEDTRKRAGHENWAQRADCVQDRGFGILELMELIEDANESNLNQMAEAYGLDTPYEINGEHKLEVLYSYYNDYFIPEVIPMFIDDFNEEGTVLHQDMPQYRPRDWNGFDVDFEDIKLYSFYEQWAKCITYDNGVDFSAYEENIPTNTTGLEPGGADVDSAIPMEASFHLWNKTSEYSFLNIESGIEKWFIANDTETDVYDELLTYFSQFDGYEYEQDLYGSSGFNETDMDLILDWLWGNGGGWNKGAFYSNILPTLLTSWYGVSMEQFCKRILFEQWSNGTVLGMDLYPKGIDFSVIIEGMAPGTTGLEAGISTPLNLTYAQCVRLWDEESLYSFTNLDGIMEWYAANLSETKNTILLEEFEFLTEEQLNLILNWLWNQDGFTYELFPLLTQAPEPYGYEATVSELSKQVLFEQWANGTALGMDLYPEGIDFSTIVDGIPSRTFGLEAGIPTSLNLTFKQCNDLWDTENNMSLVNSFDGIPKWVEANVSEKKKQILINEFNLTSKQINLILNWLWGEDCFSDHLVPILIESELGYGVPMEELCFQILLEQWANGTVMGNEMFPNGFPLPLGDKEINGFEVGIPNSTNMTLESAMTLWDISSSYSLVSSEGLKKWFDAVNGDTGAYNELKSANKLEDNCMECILEWIPDFQQNVMPFLAEYRYNLPADSLTLANSIQVSGFIIGGITIGLGSAGITRNYIIKRKRKSLRIPQSKKEMGESIQNIKDKFGDNPQELRGKKSENLKG